MRMFVSSTGSFNVFQYVSIIHYMRLYDTPPGFLINLTFFEDGWKHLCMIWRNTFQKVAMGVDIGGKPWVSSQDVNRCHQFSIQRNDHYWVHFVCRIYGAHTHGCTMVNIVDKGWLTMFHSWFQSESLSGQFFDLGFSNSRLVVGKPCLPAMTRNPELCGQHAGSCLKMIWG